MHAFVEKRTHMARFLPGSAVKQPQRGWLLRGMAAVEMAAVEMAAAGRTKKEASCATSFH